MDTWTSLSDIICSYPGLVRIMPDPGLDEGVCRALGFKNESSMPLPRFVSECFDVVTQGCAGSLYRSICHNRWMEGYIAHSVSKSYSDRSYRVARTL